MDLSDITRLISTLRAQTARDSITPNGLGSILQRIVDAISSMSGIDVEDEAAILQRLSAAESNASTALQTAQNAQTGAAGNVIDSFTQSQDEDEVSLSIKQHGHSARQVVLPAASSTGAGIMTATDKSHLDTAYGKRVNLMSAPSSESVVTLTITFGDGTTKSVTFVGATAGTGGKAGLMTKEQADQLAALVAAGPAESVRDDAGYLKQQYAAPIILRNVTDTVFDDLNIGDVYYDTGHLFYHAEGTSGDPDIGAPSRKVIYFCLADQTLYRWTGSRFVQAVSISSGDVTVPTKLSDLINDMGFLTAHQPLKTINGETITGTGNITIDGAAELKDASNHIKQNSATPVVLRNVADTMLDDLNEGDVYFDSGHLFWHTESSSGDIDLGTPSKRLIYFSIANSNFYRWTGSSFTQIAAGGSQSEILALNGVSSNQDGTIVFTDTAGNTYTVNLNHTHENMAKLVVCEESDLPSTLDPATIYAQVNDAEDPTEIEVLYIAGIEFSGGGVPAGTPVITKPSGTTLNLGTNDGSGVSQTIEIRGRSLTGDLTVTVGTGLTVTYNGTTASSVTIPLANALAGAMVTVSYSGSGTLEDGSLVISGGGATPKSVVVVVVEPYVTAGLVFHLDGADATTTEWRTRKGGVTFAMNNVTLDGNGGVVFNGTDSYGRYSAASSLGFAPATHTIEVVANIGGTATALLFMQNNSGDLALGMTGTGSIIAAVSEPKRRVANQKRGLQTISFANLAAYKNKGTLSVTQDGNFDPTANAGVFIGARDTARSFFEGTIYQIRVYNRLLTAEEILANQQVDIERYNIQ